MIAASRRRVATRSEPPSFPETSRTDVCRAQVAMEDEITKAGLQNVPGFHKKVIQMFDIFNIRFGADSVC